MADKIKPLKLETPIDGTDFDMFPTEADPNEDFVESRGIVIQNDSSADENVILSRDISGNMTFKDSSNISEITLSELLSGGGSGDDDQTDKIIAIGEVFTVKEDYQHILFEEIIIDGEYVVNGEGIIIGEDNSGSSNVVTDHGDLTGLSDDDHTQYLLANGTRGLSADWDIGSYKLTAETLESDVAIGTAPIVVASTTKVSNLNADILDDQEGSYYLDSKNHTSKHPINEQVGTTYTLQESDSGKLIMLGNTSAITLTVPSGLSTDFACTLVQSDTGQVTISAGTGVTINNADSYTKIEKRWCFASITHLGSNIFVTQGRMA